MKPFEIPAKRVVVISLTLIVVTIFIYQYCLWKKYEGNLSFHLWYHPVTEGCIDFKLSIDGEETLLFYSLGGCSNIYSVDTILYLQPGIKTITYSSDSLNFVHREKMINLLFIWDKIELFQYVDPTTPDSIAVLKEIQHSYRPIGFI